MIKSGRSSEPRCWVSARFLFISSANETRWLHLPDETKFVVAELTLDKDVPCLVSCDQAIMWPTSHKDPSKLCSVGGSEGRKTRSSVVGSQRSLSSSLSTDWCLRRSGKSIECGVRSGYIVNHRLDCLLT
jgi:hypothetical protein